MHVLRHRHRSTPKTIVSGPSLHLPPPPLDLPQRCRLYGRELTSVDSQVATEPLRARSGFKIQELDAKYHILRGNVVDLGAAPGGWSQIAARSKRVKKVVAVDLLPIDPMPGVKTLQGDFLTWEVQKAVRDLLRPGEGPTPSKKERKAAEVAAAEPAVVPTVPPPNASNAAEVELADDHVSADEGDAVDDTDEKRTPRPKPAKADTVLSDMMAAMSGVKARDTQASLDLVEAATEFAHSVLKPGGAMA